jgi:nucleotide-binding universal stress UspA family protein
MTIVVGTDGSKEARRALEWALAEARVRQEKLLVVHAWHIPYAIGLPVGPSIGLADLELLAEKMLDDELAEVDTTGVEVIAEALPGPPAMALVEASKSAGLLVIGQRGLGGFSGLLLGSVSYQVVTHAHCPVVIVRSEA